MFTSRPRTKFYILSTDNTQINIIYLIVIFLKTFMVKKKYIKICKVHTKRVGSHKSQKTANFEFKMYFFMVKIGYNQLKMPELIVSVYCTWHIFARELNIPDSGTGIFYEKALELCTPFYSIYLCWLVVKQVCIKNLLSRGLLQVLLWPISICAMDKIHIWIWTELYFQKVYETELFIFIRCGVISAQFFFQAWGIQN